MGNGVTLWLDGSANQYSDSKAETATNVMVSDSDIYKPVFMGNGVTLWLDGSANQFSDKEG
jgi:hypothetical protein